MIKHLGGLTNEEIITFVQSLKRENDILGVYTNERFDDLRVAQFTVEHKTDPSTGEIKQVPAFKEFNGIGFKKNVRVLGIQILENSKLRYYEGLNATA